MGKVIDMTGKIYNELTVLERAGSNKHHQALWRCRCSCGKETIVTGGDLRNGHVKSCGCLKGGTDVNLLGKTFGKLTVIKRADKTDKSRRIYWMCRCSCGNITIVSGAALRSGNTTSCGCLVSKGNMRIGQILTELGVLFEAEKIFPDLVGDNKPLRFDFFLPDSNVAIEFQGAQHYSLEQSFGSEEKFLKQKEYDQKKRDYCQNNGITLIEIPYWDIEALSTEYINGAVFGFDGVS